LDIVAVCLAVTAILAYINHRFIGLPTTIGVMSIALALSGVFVALDHFGFSGLRNYIEPWLKSVDFSKVLMQGMLSLLLFAGALHVDLSELRAHRWQVVTLAVFATTLSAVIVGVGVWYLLPLLGISLPFLYCLMFGVLISPTDPIAVMGIIKTAGAPKSLETVITGESLFNDGIAVVLFVLVGGMLATGNQPSWQASALLLLEEAGGGIAFGLALGYVSYWMLKSIDSYQEEVLLTLAAVVGGYELADHLHVSGPLAMVVAGLIIGNHGRALAMSDVSRAHLDMFWELTDAILNSVLFVLIGMEVLLIELSPAMLLPAVAVIVLTLLARLATVAAPLAALRHWFDLPPRSWQVLTWGGLRGGISVALALSLPAGDERGIVVSLTYAVVVFSILVQGLSMRAVTERAIAPSSSRRSDRAPTA
jgi:CPA1 family monovalent cation:H+ antiporter